MEIFSNLRAVLMQGHCCWNEHLQSFGIEVCTPFFLSSSRVTHPHNPLHGGLLKFQKIIHREGFFATFYQKNWKYTNTLMWKRLNKLGVRLYTMWKDSHHMLWSVEKTPPYSSHLLFDFARNFLEAPCWVHCMSVILCRFLLTVKYLGGRELGRRVGIKNFYFLFYMTLLEIFVFCQKCTFG